MLNIDFTERTGTVASKTIRSKYPAQIAVMTTDENKERFQAEAELARANGAWETIDYSRENVVERVLELTGGKKVPVVYDGVGKDTWETSLDCIEPRGLMVSFGNASGPVAGVNLGILNQKGSLYVTRPSLGVHVNTLEKLQAASDELFDLILKKKIKVRIDQRYNLEQAGEAQTALASRKTTGATVLMLD